MTLPFRLALVGAGRIGAYHAHTLAGSEQVRIAAVVDPRPAAAAAIGDPDTRRHGSIDELLDAGGVDGVLLAAPTVLHKQLVERLADSGLPLLSEKPCGRTSEEAYAIAEVVERSGAFLRVAFWRRFVEDLAQLRERVARGELGGVATAFSSQWDEQPPSAAFRDPRSSGGLIVDTAVHDFDLLRWVTGQEIVEAHGFASEVTYDAPVPGDPESASLVVRLSGGGTALVSVGRRHAPGEVQRLWLVGTEDAADVPYIARSEDPAMDVAFRAQTEEFARVAAGGDAAGSQLATIGDAIAALEAAELTSRALERDESR